MELPKQSKVASAEPGVKNRNFCLVAAPNLYIREIDE
jgi:hypothetical protein